MKTRFQIKLQARDGSRALVRTVDTAAAPVVGLSVVGRGWSATVESVALLIDSGEYRASCKPLEDGDAALVDLMRPFLIDDWRESAS